MKQMKPADEKQAYGKAFGMASKERSYSNMKTAKTSPLPAKEKSKKK